jgi:hypothetical protein
VRYPSSVIGVSLCLRSFVCQGRWCRISVAGTETRAAPPAVSEELPRGITKWATFTVFFTVVPIGFDLLVLLFERASIGLQVLFSDPSTYLIGFGITASGLGDAVFGKRQTGRAPLAYIISLVLSVLVLVVGAAMYALAKAVAEANPLPYWAPVCYGLASIIVSFVTVWASER